MVLMTKITVFYLPGLGGKYDNLRSSALKLWPRQYNATLLPMNWNDPNESYAQKKARVEDAIARATGQVVLVGESAGASMAFIVASQHPAVKFVGYCGKIGGAASTGDYYYERVPAFADMLPRADTLREQLSDIDKRRMITVRAYKDIFLSLRDNTIDGVRQITLPSFGHLTTIILGITIFRYGLFRAIKILMR